MGDAVQQLFSAIVQRYDISLPCSALAHHYWRQHAIAVRGIPSGTRLLDVCSGTADLASPLPVAWDTMDRSSPWTFVRRCSAVVTKKPCNKGSILCPLWPMHNTCRLVTPFSTP